MRRYTYEFDDYKKEADLIRDVNDFMMKTVGQHYHVHFLDHRSPLARWSSENTSSSWFYRSRWTCSYLHPDGYCGYTDDDQQYRQSGLPSGELKVKVINTVYEKRLPAFFMRAVQHQYPEFIMHGSRMSPETERMQPSKRYSLISVQTASACEAILLLSPHPFRNHLLRHRTRSN